MELGAAASPPSPSPWSTTTANSYRRHYSSSVERLVAIVLALIAILSPLFIDRRRMVSEIEYDSGVDIHGAVSMWLPLLLVGLIVTIAVSLHLDRRFTNFDAYWIHRVCGSSGGIIVVLIVLAFVLKCRATV